jgi:hypothetical protein
MPQLPMHIDKQAKELLGRLERLESARQDAGQSAEKAGKKSGERRALASMY